MRRLIFTVIMMVLTGTLLLFMYSNLDNQTFNYSVVLKFNFFNLASWEFVPIPMGFLLLVAFCGGMIAIAVMEALPSFYKTLELRSKNKKIRQLERELAVARELAERSAALPLERQQVQQELIREP